jgi:hypothetical protein
MWKFETGEQNYRRNLNPLKRTLAIEPNISGNQNRQEREHRSKREQHVIRVTDGLGVKEE